MPTDILNLDQDESFFFPELPKEKIVFFSFILAREVAHRSLLIHMTEREKKEKKV